MTSPTKRTGPIAVFDSGVGGLTVLHECLVSMPHEDFVYFGDTARFPYGDRTPDQLRSFALEVADHLVALGAKALVVACNSATSAALSDLEQAYGAWMPVVTVVRPESRLAASVTSNNRIGLLATSATVASRAYDRALREVAPEAELVSVACPELTPLIQEGREIDQHLVEIVDGYCAPLAAEGVDTVILGCTHYPLVRPIIQRSLGRGIKLVSSGEAIAEDLVSRLTSAGLANESGRRGSYRFLCSGETGSFASLATRFLQLPLGDVAQVDVATAVRAAGRVAV